VHDQDKDTILTKIGYRMDTLMNTSYHCLLHTLNIAMLMSAVDVIDILLDALAIEFIKELDESFSHSGWYARCFAFLRPDKTQFRGV